MWQKAVKYHAPSRQAILYGSTVRRVVFPPERLAWAQGLVPTYPSMTLYMVVDRAALPEDVLPWEVFIENRAEIDSSDLTLYINALVDATLCPPGKLVITAMGWGHNWVWEMAYAR